VNVLESLPMSTGLTWSFNTDSHRAVARWLSFLGSA
jgi:hypothetical protein